MDFFFLVNLNAYLLDCFAVKNRLNNKIMNNKSKHILLYNWPAMGFKHRIMAQIKYDYLDDPSLLAS